MKILLIISFVLPISFGHVFAEQTLKEIMTPPADSADRENLRIWVPVERRSKCRLTVDILDSDNRVIRHLVDQLVGPGYYNFYWDKKTDSGTFVDSDNYGYEVNNCGNKSKGEVTVNYQGGVESGIELRIHSYVNRIIQSDNSEDPVRLRIEWYDLQDSRIATIVDSVLGAGEHLFVISDSAGGFVRNVKISPDVPSGFYKEKIEYGGIIFRPLKVFEYKK